MLKILIAAVVLFAALPASAQSEYTLQNAARMLAEMTTGGEKVIIDRNVTVGDESTDITFTASSSAAGYHVALVFPYSTGYTKFEGYVDYGDESKRLPFKYNPGSDLRDGPKIGYLYLKVPSKPGHVAHLRFKDVGNLVAATTYCRLMVVEYH